MRIVTLKDFIFGQIDTLEDTSIPRGSASKARNWITSADRIELRRGYGILGNTIAGGGSIPSLRVVRTSGGTEIILRTRGKKLEYYKTSNETWTEIGSDVLGADADGKEISIEEYHSLAGDQIFVSSPHGPLIKIMMANLGDYADIYDAAKNYKGRIRIKQNRMFLWGRLKDKTGIYMSHIDAENYTPVADENIGTGDGNEKTFAETLDFKAGALKATCFGITVTDTVEIFTDNYDGTLTGDKGGTGTINYMTGAISVTFNTAPENVQAILAGYSWVDDTVDGIADFTYSDTRVASEGNVFRQDEAGGVLQSVESYGDDEYCLHRMKTWVLTLTVDDTNATNLIYREKVGIPNWRASVATGDGVYFIDDSDEKDPQIRMITIPPLYTKAVPISISKGLKYKKKQVGIDLSDYLFDKTIGYEWGDYILFACRTSDSAKNNSLIVYDKRQKTIDVLDYWVNCFAIYGGTLIAGDPSTPNVYTLFSGFDDDDANIINYWEGNKDDLDFIGLKKVKRIVMKGLITSEQNLRVSASIDNGPFVDIGTVEGNGSYVDSGGGGVSIGRVVIGSKEVGGGGAGVMAYNYEYLIRPNLDKFSTIKIRLEALDLGYVSVSEVNYKDIRIKSYKIPKKYRS